MTADKADLSDGVLKKLKWIAKLSNETYPGGLPGDVEGLRTLLNRIVLDVRAACALLGPGRASDKSDLSDRSGQKKREKPDLIPTHGGYRNLRSFQTSQIVYDGTVIFCDRFVSKGSRTHDQMVQAARSGRQNIAEGSMASATSKKTELKLTNVAKASLEELLLDFEDFLRQRKLPQWNKNSPEALAVRKRYRSFPAELFGQSDLSDRSDASDRPELLDPYGIGDATPEVAANTLLCLVNQAIYLLKRQIEKLERDFVEEGGFTEKLYRARTQRRRRQ
ncbi:MAG: four helix bundle suffix domain-containing protein [Thermodesulfobacteriota bacterium]|nr:four helix bundle suffix domain-containing protein [Thermodesulfobacteriota bacterium]